MGFFWPPAESGGGEGGPRKTQDRLRGEAAEPVLASRPLPWRVRLQDRNVGEGGGPSAGS